MKSIAFDLETRLFAPGYMRPKPIVVAFHSAAKGGSLLKWDDPRFVEVLEHLLSNPDHVIVGHNVAYDFACIWEHYPELRPYIWTAYDESRVSDTMLREKQRRISENKLHAYKYSLASCVEEHFGVTLEKGVVRTSYHNVEYVPLEEWGQEYVEYAKADVKWTYELYYKQSRYHVSPNEAEQCRAAFALQLTSTEGLVVDTNAVDKLHKSLRDQYNEEVGDFEREGFIKGGKRSRKNLELYMREHNLSITKTDKGNPVLNAEALRDTGDPTLCRYADFNERLTILNKDVPMLRAAPIVHTSYGLAASGRTTSFGPNMQNLGRNGGVRECLVPRPGHKFVISDYSALELVTFAQCALKIAGYSRMADLINAGKDLHQYVADQIGCDRQTAKVLNFGLLASMSADKIVQYAKSGYGIIIKWEDAVVFKKRWVATFPETQLFWKRADFDAKRGYVEQLYTGRIRGVDRFTQAANTYFQGLGADILKRALYRCWKAELKPVLTVHDEIVLESRNPDEDLMKLEEVMLEAEAFFCPDVKGKVVSKVVDRYAK